MSHTQVILKPAESTPLTAFALAELARRAGFPSGTINMLTGDPAKISARSIGCRVLRRPGFNLQDSSAANPSEKLAPQATARLPFRQRFHHAWPQINVCPPRHALLQMGAP